jgi:enoyl-CoA hydratase/carnithine racemase
MALIQWSMDENVAVLAMNNGENRLNLNFLKAMLKALDDIENTSSANALVVKATDEKIWCNGLDLDWLAVGIAQRDPGIEEFFNMQDHFFRRVAHYPMPAVAAITGHAFAGGAVLACCFDFIFMRSDRGFFCLPEVDLRIPFMPYMDALIKRALPMQTVIEAQLTGKRYTATELEKLHIIHEACTSAEETVNRAVAYAKTLNKGRGIVAEMKNVMNAGIANLIDNNIRPDYYSGDIPIK